ncbi:MAG: hypothetical protein COB66_06600 [Coxiella sp. (in: Bacteria)]|nr:MAG: hypothetical protein COB66_06600 [Coxiella sp. (in: g-proteobacteria)]
MRRTWILIAISSLVSVSICAKPNDENVYTNNQYGFKLNYPATVKPASHVRSFYHVTKGWSQLTLGKSQQGQHAVVSFPLENRKGKQGFYFYAALRVGISTHPKDVSSCYRKPFYPIGPGTICHCQSKLAFHALPLISMGMMQVMQGTSYRIRHKGKCYAVELIATGLNGPQFNALYDEAKQTACRMIYSFAWINHTLPSH